MSMSVRVDPATGLKTFATRAAKATDRIAGKGYSIITDESLKTLPELPPGAMFNAAEQAKYREFKEARAGAADYMAMEGEFAKYLDDVYSADPIPREALTDECEILVVGAGFAGLLLWHKLRDAGFHRRALLRKRRRRRRHVVLEPLSRHRVRRGVVQLLPAARGDGLRADDEVRVGLRDSRVLPEDGRQVRLLRSLSVPHHRRGNHVGRSHRALDRDDQSRRPDARALRDSRQRHPDDAEAGAHRGHGDVQRHRVPHLALELQRRSGRQARRHHRHRCDRRAGDSGTREDRQGTLRIPAHAVVDRHPRSTRHDGRRGQDLG